MPTPGFSDFVVATVLEGALELLTRPGAWTTGAQARNADGAAVKPEDDEATSWCVCGAVRRAAFFALRPSDEASRQRALHLAELAARHLCTTLVRQFGVECPTRDARRALVAFNDAEGRRQEYIVLLYRRTLGLKVAAQEGRAA